MKVKVSGWKVQGAFTSVSFKFQALNKFTDLRYGFSQRVKFRAHGFDYRAQGQG